MPDRAITFLPTLDLDRTASFYRDQVGWPEVLDQGSCRIFRIVNGAYIGFCQSETPAAEPNRIVITLVADDVDATYARWSAAEVPTDGTPRENPVFRIYHFYAQDPNGYRLEVQRFLHSFDEVPESG